MANLESCANSHLYDMSTFVAEGRIFPVSWTPLPSYFFTGKNMSESPATTSALPTLASSVAFPYAYTSRVPIISFYCRFITSAHRCSVQTAVKSRLSHAKECEVNF